MGSNARPYQEKGMQLMRDSVRAGNKRILLQSPTGSGKGWIIGQMLRSAHEKGKSVLFLVHTREIVHQVSAHLGDVPHGIIMSGEKMRLSHQIQLASKDTLIRRKSISLRPDMVIIDEAHRATAEQYSKLIESFPDALVVGFTATPARQSGKGLGTFFQDLIQLVSVRELTDHGYLAPAVYVAPVTIDLKQLKTVAGDYSKDSVGNAVQPILGDVLETYIEFGLGRQAVVFVPRVDNAVDMAQKFNDAGVSAAVVSAHTPHSERQSIKEAMLSGDLQIVCNVGTYIEGVDIPSISCVVLATATKSLARYLQMAGRGLRPGKEDCLIIDHGCNMYHHGKVDADFDWSLDDGFIGEKKEPKEKDKVKEKKEPKEKEDVVCQHCFTMYSRSPVCPGCGKPQDRYGKSLDSMRVKLGFVHGETKKPSQKSIQETTWNQFLYQGRHLNHSVKQVSARYQGKFKTPPSGFARVPVGNEWDLSVKDFLRKRSKS